MNDSGASALLDPKRNTLPIAVLLAALTVALFSPAMRYGFINYDDDAYVYENPHVPKGLTGPGLRYALTTRDIGTWAPMTWLSYEMDTTVMGFRPRSFHTTNIVLHALAGAFLFAALRRMQLSVWVSVTVAAIFLVHPLRCESVAWIAERKDVLCAFFWMLGLLAYGAYAEKPDVLRWALVFLSFIAGLMSKMMMVTFPFVLLLLDFWPLKRTLLGEPDVRKRIALLLLEKAPFFAAALIVTFITRAALRERGALNPAVSDSFGGLLRVPENYVFYLRKIFWPADLSILYPLQEIHAATALFCALLLGAMTLLAIWQVRRMPWLAVGWLWFVGTLVPVIGFVPFGDIVVADRYSYVPSVGLSLACAVAAENLFRRFLMIRWVSSAAIILACVLATVVILPRWRDSVTIYNAALRVGPHYVAYNNRGAALLKAGHVEAALHDFDMAVQLNPKFAEAHNNRGTILSDFGRYEEAMRAFDRAIESNPYYAAAYENRGNGYVRMGRAERALQEFERCLKLKPGVARTYNNRASAYFQLRRFDEAMADIETCRRLGGEPHPGLVKALEEATKAKP